MSLLVGNAQVGNGTLFLAELSVMPGLSDMTVTVKWVVNSLLYENSHLIFMEILKYAMHDFVRQLESQVETQIETQPAPSHQPNSPHKHHQLYQHSSAPLSDEKTMARTAPSKAETEEEDDDAMDARDYLAEKPAIDPAKFEQVWANSSAM